MIILDYKKSNPKQIIHACVKALKAGKVVAYPTDTCYGLAVDATNISAVKKLYRVKERQASKAVHVIVPSVNYGKRIVKWNSTASSLAKKFWPGALTIVVPVGNGLDRSLRKLSAASGFLGLRYPNNKIALDLSRILKSPITTTSANPSAEKSGGYDSYSVADIVNQFQNKKYRPDVIINAGKLPKRKPSTLVKISEEDKVEILRVGPVSERKIIKTLRNTK